jgi:hypothetical protein
MRERYLRMASLRVELRNLAGSEINPLARKHLMNAFFSFEQALRFSEDKISALQVGSAEGQISPAPKTGEDQGFGC